MKEKYFRLILFVLIIQIFLVTNLSAQEGISVAVTVSPDIILPGVPFNLTFLISHSVPDEVIVTAPPFPREFIIDRMVRQPHSIGFQDPEIYTMVEYRIIIYTGGTYTIDSFEIETPEGTTETEEFNIIVRNPAPVQRFTTQQLRWEIPPQPVTAGDRVSLTLRANNWNLQQPPASFFMPQVPQGVILSSQSVSAAERHEGIILKLLLIPLSAGTFSLPARVLEHDTVRFEIPALSLIIN